MAAPFVSQRAVCPVGAGVMQKEKPLDLESGHGPAVLGKMPLYRKGIGERACPSRGRAEQPVNEYSALQNIHAGTSTVLPSRLLSIASSMIRTTSRACSGVTTNAAPLTIASYTFS